MDKQRILIVDDIPENLHILLGVLSDEYVVQTALNGEKALKLAFNNPPDLILLDVMMPGMDGFEVCQRLKENDYTHNIPIIFITAKNLEMDEEQGLKIGAIDFLNKPINPVLVKMRVKNHLELKRYQDDLERQVKLRTLAIEKTRLDIIHKLGKAAEFKDDDTGEHVIRMSKYSQMIAESYGCSPEEAKMIQDAAPMHDVGKIGIPDAILRKPGKLNPEEWEVMKSHAEIGHTILGDDDSDLLKAATIIAYEHHEKWDGSGYPQGLKGEEIHPYARIVMIADVFDALTSVRPYKKSWPFDDAIDLIEQQSGIHFDPKAVDAFIAIIDDIKRVYKTYSKVKG